MNLRNLHNVSYVAVYEKGNVEVKGLDGAANIFVKKVRNVSHKKNIVEPGKFVKRLG